MSTPQTQPNFAAHVFVPLLYSPEYKQQAEDVCRLITSCGFAVRRSDRLHTEMFRDACRAELMLLMGNLPDCDEAQQLKLAANEHKLQILHVGEAAPDVDYPHTFVKLHEGFAASPQPALVHRLFMTGLCTCPQAYLPERSAQDALGKLAALATGAHSGNADDMYALAQAYLRADLLPYSDKQAVHWLSLAAEKQHAGALVTLGLCCLDGQGTQKDSVRGFRLLENAAELGEKRGQYYVAVCLLDGVGTQIDAARAVSLLQASAKQG
ncbi:MAG: sel1 repeat family protein, partial [Clostridia bacterium]|nr:sel1 repeat family protein [Clostridia bacterium]